MAKEQDLVFKAKSVNETRSLNKLIQDISDDIVADEMKKVAMDKMNEFATNDVNNVLDIGSRSKNPKQLLAYLGQKAQFSLDSGNTDWHIIYKQGFDKLKALKPETYKKLLLDISKGTIEGIGKDILGVVGLIPLDTQGMTNKAEFKMVRQILQNLGLKNVPKPI